MKRWIMGAGFIAIGVLASFGVSLFIVESEFFMLRPGNRNILLSGIFFVPIVIYEAAYGIWYHRCAISRLRSTKVYDYEVPWMVFAIVFEIAVLLLIFGASGVLDEVWIHVIISCLITAFFFGIAFLRCRPF